MRFGRWGSMAVMRYVQEAVMNQPAITAAAVASHLSGAAPVRATDTLRDQVRRFVAECIEGHGVYVHNVRSRLADKPCAGEAAVPSDEWLSVCGKWRYMAPVHVFEMQQSCQGLSFALRVFPTKQSCPQFRVKTQVPSPQVPSQRKSRPMTTTQPPSLPVLKDLAEDSGLDAKVFQLLTDHGITNAGTLMLLNLSRPVCS